MSQGKKAFCLVLILLVAATAFVPAAKGKGLTSKDCPLAKEDLEDFFDAIMARHFDEYHIAGAAVSVVKDGRILFTKGYGYSDVEGKIPVDPSLTMFRIGSVSKLFTWTSVMQMVEKENLDLDRDVNTFLRGTPVKIPDNYSQPITIYHLMNHNAGFEDRSVGLFSRDPDAVKPLAEVLANALPQRVRPPGEAVAYSNHGAALAGYIVEITSGMPWTSYVRENILLPLGMRHTSATQPVPEYLRPFMSKGYVYSPKSGKFVERPFEYIPCAPGGAISSTAEDMARFMMAHLQMGSLETGRIMKPETAKLMQSRSFSQDDLWRNSALGRNSAKNPPLAGEDKKSGILDGGQWLGGIAHGFLEQPFGTLRTIGHGGDTILFHSELRLIPSQNLGIFVAYNSPGGAPARDQMMRAFLERYFGSYADWPRAGTPEKDLAAGLPDAATFAGIYRSTRVPYTTVARLWELLSVAVVKPDLQDETHTSLLATLAPGMGPQRFRQVEPGVFQEEDGPGRIAFVKGSKGQKDKLLMGSAWMSEKMIWYETPIFQMGIVLTSLVILLSAILSRTSALIRRFYRKRLGRVCSTAHPCEKGALVARRFAIAMSLLYLLIFAAIVVVLQDPMQIGFGVPPALGLILWVALLAALLSPLMLVTAFLVWRKGYFTLWGRLHFSLVSIACVALALWLNHWNLVGHRF